MLFRCQPGFEQWLAKEVAARGGAVTEQGSGWVRGSAGEAGGASEWLQSLCFPHAVLLSPTEVQGESVNSLAEALLSYFLQSSREERFDAPWPLQVHTAGDKEGLGRRADAVLKTFDLALKKRMSRVAKLADASSHPRVGPARGLFVYFVDFQRAWVSRLCFFGGQQRMADDPQAPSRSYLKIEEAYGVLGREPGPGERVADLGAAPGGWSYSAAKRGAQVVAIDNGPLKAGAATHSGIEHRREDAFRFAPAPGEVYDWMFCDLVEEPHHVMRNLVQPWLEKRWCRRFVVMLKFGRVDPVALLSELLRSDSLLRRHATGIRIRHLFHDREEFTIVGETVP